MVEKIARGVELALTKPNKTMGRDLQCTIKQVKMLDSKAF